MVCDLHRTSTLLTVGAVPEFARAGTRVEYKTFTFYIFFCKIEIKDPDASSV
jgi:hypothetical protein